jgi:hypothetical protein
MKTVLTSALLAAALVIPVAIPTSAHAYQEVSVRIDTPEFGFRIGTPRVYAPPQVIYAPPVVIAPAPVYVPPRVVYAPPRVVYAPPKVIYQPVYEPYPVYVGKVKPHKHWRKHWRHHDEKHWRGEVRYRQHDDDDDDD